MEVEILGKLTRVNCPEGQEAALQAAANELNQRLTLLTERSKINNAEQLLTFAALNACYEIQELKENQHEQESTATDAQLKLDAAELKLAEMEEKLMEAEKNFANADQQRYDIEQQLSQVEQKFSQLASEKTQTAEQINRRIQQLAEKLAHVLSA